MVCCFYVLPWDRRRIVVDSTPAKILCADCGGNASELKVRNTFRIFFIPLCWTTCYVVLCQTCEWKALCKFRIPGRDSKGSHKRAHWSQEVWNGKRS